MGTTDMSRLSNAGRRRHCQKFGKADECCHILYREDGIFGCRGALKDEVSVVNWLHHSLNSGHRQHNVKPSLNFINFIRPHTKLAR